MEPTHLESADLKPETLELAMTHAREHSLLTQLQLQRDGRVYDRTLRCWVVLDRPCFSPPNRKES